MRAFGGGFAHFRRLMRAFGGCFGRVLSSLSADEPVSHTLSIVELSSQPVALKSFGLVLAMYLCRPTGEALSLPSSRAKQTERERERLLITLKERKSERETERERDEGERVLSAWATVRVRACMHA